MYIVWVEALLLAAALCVSVALRPWRLLQGGGLAALSTPVLAALVLLPFVWATPVDRAVPLALSASGACLVVLTVGWPLAIPLLSAVGVLVWQLAGLSAADALAITVCLGIVPATLAVAVGHGLRRWVGTHPVTYLAGRAYFGTMACSFAGTGLAFLLHGQPDPLSTGAGMLALWLLAVGEASVTAAVAVLLVTCLPQALATWSDRLYLAPTLPRR